ncbi:cadherin-like beta sandwich domain-containing protein [Oribacterium sp. HCP28S3_H8]|uniref:cadherin-like beta sandwich domain-containing protein n=1 Tax=Oribacterium sp. HCP28S3_H8 TaxID=3438945 RepID=UPI003F895C42
MNKIKLILATAAASLLLSISAFAASGTITFSDPSVTEGSDVNVTMKVSSTDGTLGRADVTVDYDSNLLEFVSGTDADGGAGKVRIHGATNGQGTGTLEYNLKFKTLGSGKAAITIETQEVYDTDESLVQITHEGNSTVTVSSQAAASKDASLSELTVSPGELTPAFSNDVTTYDVSVGTDVNTLAVNAVAADSGATVKVSGNDSLNMGENNVTVTVTAQDGTTQTVYTLNVNKVDGGASQNDAASGKSQETVNEGVKLSSKEKTITIMNPGSDVEIPAGFAESTIDIDGHHVKGWVWKADTDHQYCIVYGMNDAGELHFYRYDLEEKTIQRYFEDPVEANLKQNAESYPEMVEKYDALVSRYNTQFILSCVLGVVALALAAYVIVLIRSRSRSRHTDSVRMINNIQDHRENQKAPKETEEELGETKAIQTLKRSSPVENNSDLEVTQVIRKEDKAKLTDDTDEITIEDLEASDEPTISIPDVKEKKTETAQDTSAPTASTTAKQNSQKKNTEKDELEIEDL